MQQMPCVTYPRGYLNNILEKFKWLYASVESSHTLMQDFYCIAPGKSEKVETFVFCLERVLKSIKQQYPYAMTKEEGHRHLKDCLFHGFKPNLHNTLHYLYDKPDSHYNHLVMASRKAETETLRSSVSEIRVESAVVGADMDTKTKASSEPLYEAITQQIAYLMSAVVNQTSSNLTKPKGCSEFKLNGNSKYIPNAFQRPKHDKKNMACWGCGGMGHSWRECSTPRQGNNLPFRPNPQNLNSGNRPNLNSQQGEEIPSSNPLPMTTREQSTTTGS